jgi:tetratricopeptide (TPR) repeat protein
MSRLLAALSAAACGGVLLLGWAGSGGAEAGSALGLFERGTALYEAGDFDGAAEAFAGILETGIENAVVHYNLANARFKSGRLGPAIYHYRRAHALAPRDEDIRANLEYARFLALDRLEEGQETDLRVERWFDRFTPEEAYRIVAFLAILAGTAGVFSQLFSPGRRLARRSSTILLVVWALALTVAGTAHRRAGRAEEAVVLPREAQVRNGPGESFETAFVLHEGAEVVVEGERGSWTEISLPGDLRGWISSEWIAKL